MKAEPQGCSLSDPSTMIGLFLGPWSSHPWTTPLLPHHTLSLPVDLLAALIPPTPCPILSCSFQIPCTAPGTSKWHATHGLRSCGLAGCSKWVCTHDVQSLEDQGKKKHIMFQNILGVVLSKKDLVTSVRSSFLKRKKKKKDDAKFWYFFFIALILDFQNSLLW